MPTLPNATRTTSNMAPPPRVMQQSHISSFAPQYMNLPAVSTSNLNHYYHHPMTTMNNPSKSVMMQNMRHGNSGTSTPGNSAAMKNGSNMATVSMSAVMGTPVSMPHPMMRSKQGNYNVVNNKMVLQSRVNIKNEKLK